MYFFGCSWPYMSTECLSSNCDIFSSKCLHSYLAKIWSCLFAKYSPFFEPNWNCMSQLSEHVNNEILEIGLQMASNWSSESILRTCKKTKRERFRDFYGASPRTINGIYFDIQWEELGEARIAHPCPIDLLCVMYFLKKYPTKIGHFTVHRTFDTT